MVYIWSHKQQYVTISVTYRHQDVSAESSAPANLRNLPLTALRAFEAVGRHCHIRRAAEEMHVSHPALSRQVRQLEDRLGVELFYRNGNRLELTAAGKRFLHSVQAAFEQINKGILYLDPQKVSGQLVIATTPTIAMSWLLRIVAGFHRRYPEVDTRILTIEPKQRQLPAEFDVAICLGEPDDPRRQVTRLYEERYLPVCSPELLLSQPLSKASQLSQYPLLHDRLDQWQQWFTSQGVDYALPLQNTYFDHAYQAIEAARLGMGVALAEPFEVREDFKSGRLMMVMERSFTVGQSAFLVSDSSDRQSLRTRLFIAAIFDWLRDNGATLSQAAERMASAPVISESK